MAATYISGPAIAALRATARMTEHEHMRAGGLLSGCSGDDGPSQAPLARVDVRPVCEPDRNRLPP